MFYRLTALIYIYDICVYIYIYIYIYIYLYAKKKVREYVVRHSIALRDLHTFIRLDMNFHLITWIAGAVC